jgi:hypothetical protein
MAADPSVIIGYAMCPTDANPVVLVPEALARVCLEPVCFDQFH